MCNSIFKALATLACAAVLSPAVIAQPPGSSFNPPSSKRQAYNAGTKRGFTPLPANRQQPQGPLKAAPAPGSAYASITYCSAWDYSDNPSYGVFRFPLSGTPTTFRALARNENLVGNAGAVFADGKYFAAKSWEVLGQVMSMDYYVYDSSTWQQISHMTGDPGFKAMDLTCDPVTGRVYGSFVNRSEGYYYFGTLDINTGAVTEIARYGQEMAFTGIAADNDGTLFAITNEGTLYTIDRTTGAYTTVGETGLATTYTTSATIDPSDGHMYYAVAVDGQEALWRIDTSTASAQKVYDMPDAELIAGLYIPGAAISAAAPAAATNFTPEFPEGNLSGSLSFTVPSVTYSGAAASGNVTYTITIDGSQYTTGSATCGTSVTEQISVPESGEYTLGVTLTNASGTSPLTRSTLFIGHDTPEPVKDVRISYADGAFTVTWKPSAASHGGYLNPAELTYTVIRHPDGTTVATGITGTSFTDPVTEEGNRIGYTYSVYPVYRGFSADAVTSNIWYIGHITPPFTEDFTNTETLEDFTIINANGDDRTWQWDKGQMRTNISTSLVTDDYLVLPPVMLEQGKSYNFSFDVRCQMAKYPERFAAYVGTAPTVEALTTELIPATETSSETYERQSAGFTPPATGLYYFAVKGCSEPDRYYLWIDNVAITAPVEASLPSAPTAFTVTPAPEGALSATLKAKAPETDLAGNRLTAIAHMKLLRGETVIATLNPAPGEEITFTDNSPSNGLNTYTAVAYNSAGKGVEATAEAYIGVYLPRDVENVIVKRTETTGQIQLTWDRVTADTEGNPLSGEAVTYTAVRYDGYGNETVIADRTTDTSLTDMPLPPGTAQDFVQYYVTATDAAGTSSESWSHAIAVGTPYTSPWHESWAEGLSSNLYGIDRPDESTATWRLVTDHTQPGVTSHDGDNGYLMFEGNSIGEEATIFSGLIDLTGLNHPAIQLYYNAFGASNTLEIMVNDGQGDGFVTVRKVEMAGESDGWTRILASLEEYKGKQIQWAVKGTLDTHRTNVIDNISILSVPEINAAMSGITAPIRAKVGEKAIIETKVENAGVNPITDYTLTLRCNGKEYSTLPGGPLESGMSAIVPFEVEIGAISPRDLVFSATVEMPGDEIADDNTSDEVSVRVLQHPWPSPSGITAEATGEGATIKWNAPDLNFPTPVEITDGAEDYVSFSIGLSNTTLIDDNIGEWTMVDRDGLYTIGIGTGNTLMPNATLPMAFQVFCAADGGLQGEAWTPHSGRKMFVAFSAIAMSGENERNDDWMISPQLTGHAQRISFYGRSATDLYGYESMEILYSTTTADPSDFISIATIDEVPAEWTSYSYNLPEGAKYFAIRCTSDNKFALCIDDVTFTPGGFGVKGLELLGYNVYRDSTPVNSQPLTLPVFHDPDAMTAPHTYQVTALYNLGESSPSELYLLDPSNLSDVVTGRTAVRGLRGAIAVEAPGRHRVTVTATDGTVITTTDCNDRVRLPISTGIYIVNIDRMVFKVLVR